MRSDLPPTADITIIGGGFAGASTAAALVRANCKNVLLLEAEPQFGMHATGLNAAMARHLDQDPTITRMAAAGIASIRDDEAWPDHPVDFRNSGSLLLFSGAGQEALLAAADALATTGPIRFRGLDRAAAVARVSVLQDADFAGAIETPGDGVVDIHALLWRYLNSAREGGARLLPGCPVREILRQGDRVTGVRTDMGDVSCPVVVNAAGAWANRVSGLPDLPMKPFRRHLMVTPPLPWVDPRWPFVWDLAHGHYFRPEMGGLLLCPGDQEAVPPGAAVRDPAALEALAERLARHVPALADVAVSHWWAGLRTIASDHRFVIGPDPRLTGLHWVAALGGHGMTTSAAVGELAAALLLGRDMDRDWSTTLSPARFLAKRREVVSAV